MLRGLGLAFFFLFLCYPLIGQKSLSNLPNSDSIVSEISKSLYNQDYDGTKIKIDQLSKQLPEHPIVDLLYALNIVWKTIPDGNPKEFPEMERHLKNSIEKAELILDFNKEDVESTFFLLMAHGLLAQYYGEQGSSFKAISEAKRAYNSVIKGIDMKEQYHEYYFSSGLYNYFREKQPQLHPVYKTFVWIFRSGSIEKGIAQLKYARKNAVLSKVEAGHYLAYIYMRNENDPEAAKVILNELLDEYPNNTYFKMLKVECLDMTDQVKEIKYYLDEFLNHKQEYVRMFGNAYCGVFAEKGEGDQRRALHFYRNTLEIGKKFEDSGNHPKSVAYAGLGRIADANNDEKGAIAFYKNARKIATAPKILEEAKAYLKNH